MSHVWSQSRRDHVLNHFHLYSTPPPLKTHPTMGSTDIPLSYWQLNVPASERTVECPPYLQNISQYDIGQVSILDSEYERMSWPTLKQIIGANKLDHLRRVPSDLRKYFEFRYRIKKEYGSIMEFILKHRLGWETPIVPEAKPFGSVNDVKILYNDWPCKWCRYYSSFGTVTEVLKSAWKQESRLFMLCKFQSFNHSWVRLLTPCCRRWDR